MKKIFFTHPKTRGFIVRSGKKRTVMIHDVEECF